jgi:tRNA (mo5U34)-methyltransferase
MKYQEIKENALKIKWWHSIALPSDDGDIYITNGEVDHCTEDTANNRFGISLDLKGKSILDAGCWDGYFSFLAEKRGAKVSGCDPLQGCSHFTQGTDGFVFAKKILNSKIDFEVSTIEDYSKKDKIFDIVFLYGTLYHIENPVEHLTALSKLTKEYALIETAISQTQSMGWEFNNGFNNDPTNFWYPSINGLEKVLKYVGFNSMELIYNDGIRITVKAIK